MAQGLKELATKPEDMSSIPEIRMVEDRTEAVL